MIVSAEFRLKLTLPQINRLIAAGLLPPEPESPDDLEDAINALLATLPASPAPAAARAA